MSETSSDEALEKTLSGSWKGDLSSLLRKVRTKREFSDVTFVVEEQEFPAHRAILSSCSPFFENLLSNGFKESTKNRIQMGEVRADIFRMVLDFIYGETISMKNFEEEMELLSCAHRYELEDLQLFVAKLTVSKVANLDKSDYFRDVMNAAHSAQNKALKCKLFSFLADRDVRYDCLIQHVHSLDMLEEVVDKLPAALCYGEIEVLEHILNCFGNNWADATDTQEQKERILSHIDMEKLSEADLRYAIKMCKEFVSQPSVTKFRESCIQRLVDKNYQFELSTPVPNEDRAYLSRNIELFSFRHRLQGIFSTNRTMKSKRYRDSETEINFWIELHKSKSENIRVTLCSSEDSAFGNRCMLFVLDASGKEHRFGDAKSSYGHRTIKFEPSEWNKLIDRDTGCIVVGATVYYY